MIGLPLPAEGDGRTGRPIDRHQHKCLEVCVVLRLHCDDDIHETGISIFVYLLAA